MTDELAEWKKINDEQNRKAAERRAANKSNAKNKNQQLAENGIILTPNPPDRRDTWNDEPPEDS